ncbi:hypothetical protein M407DRAFT_16346 [Tulasnella calospora MUT 4182]|uniref:Tc1-like transposase DDE domain-containing protein n=1 Tax=Tulasnella calospora MUT 4182 TaxID=1051891 RepID=A0A0C3K7A1_9AGAM|nr:hypothetical protein M407DRAFT_16346 [Tulasnella calospora MUT 4182]
MVADFVSPEFGWCRSSDGNRSTRVLFKAGKNRDGYFTAEDVQAQTHLMLDIFEERFPNGSAITVLGFDNAPSHQRRSQDAQEHTQETKELVSIWGDLSSQFKGMKTILEEQGLLKESRLNAECPGFKCPPRANDIPASCCCRRVLFEQPDFRDQKPELIELVEKRGHIAYFFPKYHCELNFIEMCWGAAKAHYRVQPPTSTEAEMEVNVIKSLDSVPLEKMRRFSIRSARFIDAYRKGLDGAQAAWANKKYHGHRTLPTRIMTEF